MNWEPLPPNTSRSLYRDWKLPTGPYKVGMIPTEWDVSEVLFDSMQRRTDEAIANGCTLIIYDLTTYGGDLFAWDRLDREQQAELLAHHVIESQRERDKVEAANAAKAGRGAKVAYFKRRQRRMAEEGY